MDVVSGITFVRAVARAARGSAFFLVWRLRYGYGLGKLLYYSEGLGFGHQSRWLV